MEKPFTLSEGVDSWNTIIFLYNSALKEQSTVRGVASSPKRRIEA